ncbi:hypothetical protein [Streptomyces sp. NPDC002845]
MGTETVDEAGAETGTEAKRDEEAVDVTKGDVTKEGVTKGDVTKEGVTKEGVTKGETAEETSEGASDAFDSSEELTDEQPPAAGNASVGVGQGAAGIVSVALGLVSLTGSWLGTVAQARDSLYGQLETAADSSVATQIEQVYGNSWNANALVAGIFALIALIVGVVVLVRPAFGDPDQAQAPWIKSVAWAGISLGVIGLVLATLKYTDILLSVPGA